MMLMHTIVFQTSSSLLHGINSPRRRQRLMVCSLDADAHFSVCTGPSCKQANSANTRQILEAVCPHDSSAAVEAVGCLGECGNGPNVGVTRRGMSPFIQKGVRTVADALELVGEVGVSASEEMVSTLKCKERADDLLRAGKTDECMKVYDEVVKRLKSGPLLAKVLCNRSVGLRETGRMRSACDDANRALEIEPGLAAAWKRKAEAHEGLGERKVAETAWLTWGKLSSQPDEAAQRIRKLKRWRLW